MNPALAVAERLGLPVDDARVLADGSNRLIHFPAAGVVARVPALSALWRGTDAWLRREVAVAGFLAAAGAPVVAPARDPGPHAAGGTWVTLWEYAGAAGPLDACAAGRALRECHDALAAMDPAPIAGWSVLDEALDVFADPAQELALSDADRAWLVEHGAAVRAQLLAGPLQVVHGDASLDNVVQTAAGPRWNDWEDAWVGPVAWDLACLEADRVFGDPPEPIAAALAGYGAGVVDPVAVQARVIQGIAWAAMSAAARDVPYDRAELDWLQARS